MIKRDNRAETHEAIRDALLSWTCGSVARSRHRLESMPVSAPTREVARGPPSLRRNNTESPCEIHLCFGDGQNTGESGANSFSPLSHLLGGHAMSRRQDQSWKIISGFAVVFALAVAAMMAVA